MEPIGKWFNREVLQWRTGASVAWSVITLPVVCVVYLLFASVQPLSPFTFIAEFASRMFAVSFVFMVAVVLLVNGLFYSYSSRTFTGELYCLVTALVGGGRVREDAVELAYRTWLKVGQEPAVLAVVFPAVAVSRLGQLIQLVKMPCLLYCCVSGLCGAVLAWACTGMLGPRYATLLYKCTEQSELYCMNEHHLFMVLYGIYSGIMYVFYHYYKQQNYLQFPSLQEAKFFQVRGRLLEVLYSSVGHVIWQIKFFYILYYCAGSVPRDWIASTLSLKFGSEYRLDSLYGLLLDFPLLWQTFLFGLFLQFTWSYGALLYKVYNTEHFEFPISTVFDNFKNKCLVDAMSCRDIPLIQALGFYDLNVLSKYSQMRRKELFSLSQPGGHPHNWNKIIAVCLSVVNELSDQIQDANWKILSSAPVRQPNGDKHVPQNVSAVGNGHILDTTRTQTQQQPPTVTFKDKVFTMIKKLPILSQVTKEVPETKNKSLFLSCQIQIWSVEALSCLVSASYTEDSYGVVQMSLTNIITAILNLQENVEKHFKLTGGVTRRSQKDTPTNDVTLKYLLQTTIKSSLYRIVNTFGNHIMELHLPAETEKKIRHFIDYRE